MKQISGHTRAEIRALFLSTKSKLHSSPTGPKEKLTMLPKISEEFDPDEATYGHARGKKRPAKTSAKTNTVPLTWEQVQKLWAIVMGGQIITEENEDSGEIVYHVSLDAVTKAVPTLLDRI